MITQAICPKCEKPITSMTVKPMTATVLLGDSYKGVAYVCPHCAAAISFQIDPLAVRAEMVAGVKSAVTKIVDDAVEDSERRILNEVRNLASRLGR